MNLQSRLWAAPIMSDEEQEELERKANMLKIKLAQTSDCVKEWGMTTGLERMAEFEQNNKKWHAEKPANEKLIFLGLLPVAILFLGLVFCASLVRFLHGLFHLCACRCNALMGSTAIYWLLFLTRFFACLCRFISVTRNPPTVNFML